MIQLLIFDLDGVLWDSSRIHEAAFNEIFQKYGNREIKFNYYSYSGWKTREVISQFFGATMTSTQIDNITKEKQDIAFDMLNDEKILNSKLVQNLYDFSQHVQLGLATSASKRSLELFLSLSGTSNLFRHAICSDDVDYGKPHPDIYKRFIELAPIKRAHALVVEDSEAGIRAAKQCGLEVVHLSLDPQKCMVTHRQNPCLNTESLIRELRIRIGISVV